MSQPDDLQVDATPDEKPRLRKRGWALLFVPTLVVIDIVGMLASQAGQNRYTIVVLGLTGFACGGAIGAYYSVKHEKESIRSHSFWIVAFGLIGTMFTITLPVVFSLSFHR